MFYWILLAVVPYFIQALALAVDEFFLHHRRGLPQWERWGHPLDTLSVLIVNVLALSFSFSEHFLFLFVLLGLFSCLFVTKDEWVHSKECSAFEHWLHGILFVCHPLTFVSTCFFWILRDRPTIVGFDLFASQTGAVVLIGQVVTLSAFFAYQIIYWNFVRPRVFDSVEKSSLPVTQSVSAGPQSSA